MTLKETLERREALLSYAGQHPTQVLFKSDLGIITDAPFYDEPHLRLTKLPELTLSIQADSLLGWTSDILCFDAIRIALFGRTMYMYLIVIDDEREVVRDGDALIREFSAFMYKDYIETLQVKLAAARQGALGRRLH